MSGYVEAGYLICFGTLGVYAVSLLTRERAARRRLPADSTPTRASTVSENGSRPSANSHPDEREAGK